MAIQTGNGTKTVNTTKVWKNPGGFNKDMANLPPSTARGKRRAAKRNKK